MAYKITKYAGKHKIKDVKTGKSVEIDIEKFMGGGKGKKKLTNTETKEVRETTGLDWDAETANRLFETIDPPQPIEIPDFNLGRYKDVDYFNVNYANDEFTIAPTKRNPGNYSKHKEYLKYLQKQNPDVKINTKPNKNGYLNFNKRLEFGGYITSLSEGGDKGKKKLTNTETKEVREATGLAWDAETANRLFETIDPPQPIQVPDFNLGRYKDVNYFNVNYANDEFTVSPTKRNPGNYSKHREYLKYLQEQNPDVRVNTKDNKNGYLAFNERLEYGGEITQYAFGGEECDPGDTECLQRQQSNSSISGYGGSQLGMQKNRYQFLLDAGNEANAKNSPFYDPSDFDGTKIDPFTQTSNPNVSTSIASEDEMVKSRQDFIDAQKGVEGTQAGVEGTQAGVVGTEVEAKDSIDSPNTEEIKTGVESTLKKSQEDKNFNLFNPYAGVDIPTAAYTLGHSIKDKNTLGIVGSSVKLGAGLGRNIMSGLGHANRGSQVMGDFYKEQKNKRHVPVNRAEGGYLESFAYGGKKDEELATGEFMHGVSNENTEEVNAEIEKGEYFQSSEGDIAEVVGDKHSQGGEKIQMEKDDRVLSDKSKLGGKVAKELSEKYDLKLKAKHTYSDVLDKFKKKSKLDKIIEEEAEILKKIGEQDKVGDATTRSFNLDVLTKKQQEIVEKKHPIEEERKFIFDELFNIQEDAKSMKKEAPKTGQLEFGGDFEALAKEFNIPLDRAKQVIQEFANGGKMVPKYGEGIKIGDIDPVTGKKVTAAQAKEKVASGEWERIGTNQYIDRGIEGSSSVSQQDFNSYRQTWDKNKFPKFEEYVQAAEEWKKNNPDWNKGTTQNIPGTPDKHFYTEPSTLTAPTQGIVQPSMDIVVGGMAQRQHVPKVEEYLPEDPRQSSGLGTYLFPGDHTLAPTALQGTIKPERRYDRVSPNEINIEPYLQDSRDRDNAQVQNLEGLSPNVRAAALANMRANAQKQESNIRNQIDTQNLQSVEKAEYTNAQIQAREENASAVDRLKYEQRQYRAQALTDYDLNEYYNHLQANNKQKFMDIHNLNLVNATNEDVYFDGQSFKRKTTDREILSKISQG